MAISLLLAKPKSKFNPSAFHKLRVEIKKIKALFDLVNFCSSEFKRRKAFRPFKLIFQQAGKVRQFQVEESMLKKYFPDNALIGYRKRLKTLRLKEQEQFFLMHSKKIDIEMENGYHQIITAIRKVKSKEADNYIKKETGNIKKLLTHRKMQASQLHELRKRLKTLDYNRKSLSLKMQNTALYIKPALPALLGKWHDCQIIIGHIEKAIKAGAVNSGEIYQLKKIKTKITMEAEVINRKIDSAIAELKNQMADIY